MRQARARPREGGSVKPREFGSSRPASETPARLESVCPECGQVFTREDSFARCGKCHPRRWDRPSRAWERKGSPESRGYDRAWRNLSVRARRLQPWCSDCRSPEDLTADHSPTAWARRSAGKAIRLRDIDVVCRRCNSDRGPARGEAAREDRRPADLPATLDELDRLGRESLDPTRGE